MDRHTSHSKSKNRSRSRSSQTPSPSPASATSSYLQKRKLAAAASEDLAPHCSFSPSSFSAGTRYGALNLNDDPDNISAPGAEADSDAEYSEDADFDDEEDEFDHVDDSSIRNFTAARLETVPGGSGPGSSRNSRPKTEFSKVKIENFDDEEYGGAPGSGFVGPAAGKSTSGIAVKEDVMICTGAYAAREENLKREEEAGRLKFVCHSNDDIDEHMIWLIGLKNIFSRQLPNMPKEYIVRLVMDRNHKSVMVISHNQVVGGITYRPYASQRFGEIAFCAITSDEQVKGYGTRLMNHLKQHARDVDGLTHFLTYADNNAVGYFTKQGFTKEIHLEKKRWLGYIKDYDGGVLMECEIDPKLPFTDLSTMIRRQRQVLNKKIRELSNCQTVYPGIEFQKKETGILKRIVKVEDIPGLKEAGWTPDQFGHSWFKVFSASPNRATNQKNLTIFMRSLVKVGTNFYFGS